MGARERSPARAGRRRFAWCSVLVVVLTGCAATSYSPCPVELQSGLPADAFARVRRVLLGEWGELTVADEQGFLLRTAWIPTDDPPGERRAAVFRDGHDQQHLAVVVELRWLRFPLLGLPEWSEPRGDVWAERGLADRLQRELSP